MDITQVTGALQRAVILFTANWLSERHQDKNAAFRV